MRPALFIACLLVLSAMWFAGVLWQLGKRLDGMIDKEDPDER